MKPLIVRCGHIEYLPVHLLCEQSVPLTPVPGEDLVVQLASAGVDSDVAGEIIHRAHHHQAADVQWELKSGRGEVESSGQFQPEVRLLSVGESPGRRLYLSLQRLQLVVDQREGADRGVPHRRHHLLVQLQQSLVKRSG